jgi:hypothetical protein
VLLRVKAQIYPVALRNRVTGRKHFSPHPNPLAPRNDHAPVVTLWHVSVPLARFSPALGENSLPGDCNRWSLWSLSVVLTERAREHIRHWRFRDVFFYFLVITTVLLLEFVTLAEQCDSDLWASHFVTLYRAPSHPRRCITRSPRAAPRGPAWAAPRGGGRGPVCWPSLPGPSRESAAPTCRQNAG